MVPEMWNATDGRTDGRMEKVTYRGRGPSKKLTERRTRKIPVKKPIPVNKAPNNNNDNSKKVNRARFFQNAEKK